MRVLRLLGTPWFPRCPWKQPNCRDSADARIPGKWRLDYGVPTKRRTTAPSMLSTDRIGAKRETIELRSLGDALAGVLFLPACASPAPALIICHGAGEFKENYFEL